MPIGSYSGMARSGPAGYTFVLSVVAACYHVVSPSARFNDGLVKEHDGNIVPHRIDPMALPALQALWRFAQRELTMARRADQDLKQLFRNHVPILPFKTCMAGASRP